MMDPTRVELDEMLGHIEETWEHFNVLFDDLESANGWGGRHGPDWTFADVPYHLAYCNRDLLIRGIEMGKDLPEEEQELLFSIEMINDWNTRHFEKRPAGQTAVESVAQWRETCQAIRRITADMTDADLARPFWMPLFKGWSDVGEGLAFTRAHEWGEFMQLRIHMGREEPVSSAGVTRAYLGRMLGAYPMFLDREAAAGRTFTVVMAFTDPDVGAFTLRVADGAAELSPGAAADPDLAITQSAETFLKSLTDMHDPGEAIRSGQVQVSDFASLGAFGELFPLP